MSGEGERRRWVGRQAWWAPGFLRLTDRIGYGFAIFNGSMAVFFLFFGF